MEGKSDRERPQWMLLYFLRLGHKGVNHVYGRTWDSSLGLFGPPDCGIQYIEEMMEFGESGKERRLLPPVVIAQWVRWLEWVGRHDSWDNFFCFDP